MHFAVDSKHGPAEIESERNFIQCELEDDGTTLFALNGIYPKDFVMSQQNLEDIHTAVRQLLKVYEIASSKVSDSEFVSLIVAAALIS